MGQRTYRVAGKVIGRQTRKGIPGVRVETWDKDTRYHDLLGERVTDNGGGFSKTFDEDYFGDYAPDRSPDLFFKVYRGERLIASTEESVIWNVAEGDTSVVIEVDEGIEKEVHADRLSGAQVMKGVDFILKSDFRGVLKDVSKRMDTAGTLIGDIVTATLSKMDFAPIKSSSYRTHDVIGQDTITAQKNLDSRQVVVTEVKPYQPDANLESIQSIAALPVNLKNGDKVVLYEKEGRVQSYSIVKERAPSDVNAGEVVRLSNEMTTLRASVTDLSTLKAGFEQMKGISEQNSSQMLREVGTMESRMADIETTKTEVTTLRREIAEKDTAIASLNVELKAMKAAHDSLASRLQPEMLERMQKDLSTLLLQKKEGGAEGTPKRGRKKSP